MTPVEICHLYISRGHNFFGHHEREPDEYPAIEVPMIECVAGHGIRSDRFFDYKGQITFFSLEVFDELCGTLQVQDCSPALVRRNVLTRDVDLNQVIGQEFEIQGVRFHGTGECRPCYWMDRAIAPGAEEFLKGRGGLRARIVRPRGFASKSDEHQRGAAPWGQIASDGQRQSDTFILRKPALGNSARTSAKVGAGGNLDLGADRSVVATTGHAVCAGRSAFARSA